MIVCGFFLGVQVEIPIRAIFMAEGVLSIRGLGEFRCCHAPGLRLFTLKIKAFSVCHEYLGSVVVPALHDVCA